MRNEAHFPAAGVTRFHEVSFTRSAIYRPNAATILAQTQTLFLYAGIEKPDFECYVKEDRHSNLNITFTNDNGEYVK